MKSIISQRILDSISVKQKLLAQPSILDTLEKVVEICSTCMREDGKILMAGNGGSAADAQHLSAEFSGRFYKDRKPLFAEALHVNSSYLTAVANDYGYDEVYSRLIEAKGRKNDVFWAFSTSGNSQNIIKALEKAKDQEMITIGFTGETGGKMKSLVDFLIAVPSLDTPRIQECHILVGHIICELVEEKLFDL